MTTESLDNRISSMDESRIRYTRRGLNYFFTSIDEELDIIEPKVVPFWKRTYPSYARMSVKAHSAELISPILTEGPEGMLFFHGNVVVRPYDNTDGPYRVVIKTPSKLLSRLSDHIGRYELSKMKESLFKRRTFKIEPEISDKMKLTYELKEESFENPDKHSGFSVGIVTITQEDIDSGNVIKTWELI